MNQDTLSIVTVILSVGSTILLIVFGYVVFRMSQIFVTKTELQAYQSVLEKDHSSLRKDVEEINRNTLELLQRTAHLRSHGNV